MGISWCTSIKSLSSSANSQISQTPIPKNHIEPDKWQLILEEEQERVWSYILNSPLAIAALNQLAIEGFISPQCPKVFYSSKEYGGFKTLLQVKCNSSRGISIASPYQEMHIIFERFEDNIEDFQIKRFYLSE